MRFFISGPRLFSGLIRPGVSFGLPRYASAQRNAAAALGEYIYVIENQHGHVKIGISSNPSARLANLQTGSPVPISIAFKIFAGDRAFDIEQEAHIILASRRLEGEWFAASKDAAIASVYAAAARLSLPIGKDAAVQGASMERRIAGVVLTAAILFVVLSGMSGLPVEINRVVAAAVVAVLLFRRLVVRRPTAL